MFQKLVPFIAITLQSTSTLACDVGSTATCETGAICMNSEAGPICKAIPAHASLPPFRFPFEASSEVICTHSSGVGSHSWPNSFFALDLATPYQKSPSIIVAAADGKAFNFFSDAGTPCKNPSGTPEKSVADNCGNSWGNSVKLLHDHGFFSFYTHLDVSLVATGTLVKKGDPIGIEGWTGAAGHRHLHWSVQKLPGSNLEEWERNISWTGISVPFQFEATVNSTPQLVDTEKLYCPHANIGQVDRELQPRIRF
jgi:hypothetical protein